MTYAGVEATVGRPRSTGVGPPPRRVRLLDVHPDLGADFDAVKLPQARRTIVCPVLDIDVGPWDANDPGSSLERGAPFAYVVIDGLIARDVVLDGRVSITLYGPRDLLGHTELAGSTPPVISSFRALTPVRIAVLDDHFLACVQRWPRLASRLTQSAVEQIGRGCVRQAISQLGRAEHRLVAILWMLADRWGSVGPGGIAIDLSLTHEALGCLIGARRPTVTLAMRQLTEDGLVQPNPGRANGWLLSPNSLDLLQAAPDPIP